MAAAAAASPASSISAKSPVEFKWTTLKTIEQLKKEMLNYLKGKYTTSPWMFDSLALESQEILDELVRINELNYITVESQPDSIEYPLINIVTGKKVLHEGEELVYKQHFYSSGIIDKRRVDIECLKMKLKEVPHFFSVIVDYSAAEGEEITYINLDETRPDFVKSDEADVGESRFNLSYSETKDKRYSEVDTIYNVVDAGDTANNIATDEYGTISTELLNEIRKHMVHLHIIDYRVSELGDTEKRNALGEIITIFEACQIKRASAKITRRKTRRITRRTNRKRSASKLRTIRRFKKV